MKGGLTLLGTAEWPRAALSGEIDLANAGDLADRVEAAVPNTAEGVVLDLSAVTYLDSSGLRLVFRLARRLGDRQQRLRLVVPPTSRITRVLAVAGVATVAEILTDVPDESGRTTP